MTGPGRRKSGRLSRSAEFERVYRQGRSLGSRHLVLYTFPREDREQVAGTLDDAPRLGLSVSRKVGGAVERNRVKRLLREAFASEGSGLPGGHDVVVVARPSIADFAEREGVEAIRGELRELIAQAAQREQR